MKKRIGEFNGRPLVTCSDEHEVKYPELLVTTDTSGDKISDIQQRNGDKLESILDATKSEDQLPEGWEKTIRKSFQVGSYKTFVQQYADGTYDGTYNVVAILVPELEESVGFIANYNNSDIAIVDNEDASITVVGDLTLPYDYSIRVVLTPDFNGVWEEKTTVNELLKVSLTLKN